MLKRSPDPIGDRLFIPARRYSTYVDARKGEHQGPSHRLQRRLGLRAGREPESRVSPSSRVFETDSADVEPAPIRLGRSIPAFLDHRRPATRFHRHAPMMKGAKRKCRRTLSAVFSAMDSEEFTDAKMIPADFLQSHVAVHGHYDLLITPTSGAAFPLYMQGPRSSKRRWSLPATALLHLHLPI